jgi:hypothetical protein
VESTKLEFEFNLKTAPFRRGETANADVPADGEQMYQLSEAHFGTMAPRLVSLGWSVFPQERDGKRKPGKIDGAVLKWKPYQNRLPMPGEVRKWAAQCPTHNVALILGAASGNTFAVDIDVEDEPLAWLIRALAGRILGETALKRIGRAPRIILLYRLPEGARVKKMARRFLGEDGKPSDNMVEILYDSPATVYGLHHKTRRYFWWPENQPLFVGPEKAPLVAVAQVEEFLMECGKLRAFQSGSESIDSNPPPSVAVDYYQLADVRVPKVYETPEWIVEDGVVVAGREKFATKWCFRFCGPIENAGFLQSESGLRKLVEVARNAAVNCVRDDGKRSRRDIDKLIDLKIRSAAGKFVGPEATYRHWSPMQPKETGGFERMFAHSLPVETIPGLEWLGNGDSARGLDSEKKTVKTGAPVLVEGAREERAIQPDRTATSKRIAAEIRLALSEFISDASHGKQIVHVIPAPTGSGKSTATIKALLDSEESRHLFLSPTHANIEGVVKDAKSCGAVIPEDEGYYDEGAKRIIIYKGKVRAGCKRPEEVESLQKLGIGTEGLCKTTRKNAFGNKQEVYCHFFAQCPYQKQLRDAEIAKIIVAAHSYATLPTVPKALREPSSVTIDESLVFKVAHTAKMAFATLQIRRPRPTATKREKANGFSGQKLLDDRDRAAHIATMAGHRGEDVAKALFAARAREYLDNALEVCKRVMSIVSHVAPDLSGEQWCELTGGGEGYHAPALQDVHLEWRFWKTVEARYDALVSDELTEQITGKRQNNAKGDQDYFLQILTDTVNDKQVRSWRVSWRSKINWSDRPTLLIDASARKEFVGVFYPSSTIKFHAIDSDRNVRTVAIADATYSPSSMAIREGDSESAASHNARASAKIEGMRKLVATVCGRSGDGRVFAVAPLSTREMLFRSWRRPKNLDTGHYGASCKMIPPTNNFYNIDL